MVSRYNLSMSRQFAQLFHVASGMFIERAQGDFVAGGFQ